MTPSAPTDHPKHPAGMGSDTGAAGLRVHLRHHPAPRFLVIGGLSYLVDIAVLKLLHGEAHVALLAAATVSFAVASLVNFALNRQWVFATGRGGRAHRQLVRFYVLVGLNLLSTLLIMGGLAAVGVYYLLAKTIAIVANAVANFFAYRRWVFR